MAAQSKIIRGSEIREFNFFFNGCIHRGGTMLHRLYKLVGNYDSAARLQAFQLATDLEQEGIEPLVSVEWDGSRRVWVDVAVPISSLCMPIVMSSHESSIDQIDQPVYA